MVLQSACEARTGRCARRVITKPGGPCPGAAWQMMNDIHGVAPTFAGGALLVELPVAALDLDPDEGVLGEAVVVGGAVVEDARGADEGVGLLDGVA